MCRHERVGEVKRYITQRPTSKWNVNSKNGVTNKSALREAVEHHNYDVIKMLVGLGADPNMRDGKDDDFILYAALRDTSPGAIKTTRLLLTFMETKADPDGQAGSSNTMASSDGKRYWLETSRNRKNYRPDDMVQMGVPHLPRFIFSLAGQAYAQWKLVKEISVTLANQETYHRMVFVLGGPPGHGKTMTAEALFQILGEDASARDFLKISCANVNSLFELFGGSGAYRGSEVGSELNNFVANHRDRVGIVNLDEFDKLEPKVRDGLFTIFDKGEWVDKKMSLAYQTKTLDCKKIIWVLTTNIFDNDIISFYEEEVKRFEQRNWIDLEKRIKKAFQGKIKGQFGDALARRIGSLIPFVPFTKPDRIAFVENEIDTFRYMHTKPAVKKTDEGAVRLVGNFEFTVEPEVGAFIADQYDTNSGATSLKDCVKAEILDTINGYHLDGESLRTQGVASS